MIPSHDLLEPLDCELVVGLVGAIGTKFQDVINQLQEQLKLANYIVQTIRVSDDVIRQIIPDAIPESPTEFERYSAFMVAGNTARQQSKRNEGGVISNGNNAILALGAAARIFEKSLSPTGERLPKFKHAYIINSLKRKEEVEALRTIYGDGFVLLGIHECEEQRLRNLSNQDRMTMEQAKTLIARDFAELSDPYGQRVNETFHLADFFVEIGDGRQDLACNIQRLVEICFGHPYRTPTFDEYAMYMAYSAALRSADLSRQVGAVLTRNDQILSTGANECPKPLGGLYWAQRTFDRNCGNDTEYGRDYLRGIDSNRKAQLEIIESIVAKLFENPDCDEANVTRRALHSTPISELTEYGRVVHAEMEALLACGRIGVSTHGTTLYCTTFPCHNCAKHIIAAGVTKVVYIEPYPKSRALAHHQDAITTEPSDKLVQFVPFTGIGPRRYFDLFSIEGSSSYRIKRKDRSTGKTVPWQLQGSRLRIQMRAFTYLDAETQAAKLFKHFIPDGAKSND